MRLPELQKHFIEGILLGPEPALIGAISNTSISPQERFETYRQSYYQGTKDALQAAYPALEKLVSPAFFALLARDYASTHPPFTGNMNDFGASLAHFLQSYQPAIHLAYLPDLARFEWAMHECLNAQDDDPLNPSALASLGPDDMAQTFLPLRANVRILSCAYNISRLWHYCLSENGYGQLSLPETPTAYILFRDDCMGVCYEKLDTASLAALKNLSTLRPLLQTMEMAQAENPDFQVEAFFSRFFARDVFKKRA